MEFKGTKGEWYKMNASQMGVPFIIVSGNETLFQVYGENAEYNANLALSSQDLLEALQEIQIDLSILKSNFIQIEKTDSRAEGMTDIIDKWIERNKKAIEKALL